MQWMSFCDAELGPAVGTWIYPILGFMQNDKKALDRAQEDIKKYLAAMNQVGVAFYLSLALSCLVE